jgi:succinate dehydrogenase / fumarate reductase, iron-sulfur subunit
MDKVIKIWRQIDQKDTGQFIEYVLENIDPDLLFLEMLDMLNEKLIKQGVEPVAFEHNCRQGTCGSCGAVVNSQVNGNKDHLALCLLSMRDLKNQEVILLEPFRATAFPVHKDLIFDKTAMHRIQNFVQDESVLPQNSEIQSSSRCISCGACVASCPNAAAALFVGAQSTYVCLTGNKGSETKSITEIVKKMDSEGFGICLNNFFCEQVSPAHLNVSVIAQLKKKSLFDRN